MEVYDSKAINRIISSISNEQTGIGTDRDKTIHGNIEHTRTLTKSELSNLYKSSGLLRRIVNIFPKECSKDWMKISPVVEKESADIDIPALEDYLMSIPLKMHNVQSEGYEQFEQEEIDLLKLKGNNLKVAFRRASAIARQHGSAYIVMGIADGRETFEPVKLDSIESIEWLKVVDCYRMYPDSSIPNNYDPRFYNTYSPEVVETKWHNSRVLRFIGNEIYDDDYLTEHKHHSVIQSVYETWLAWNNGLMSGSSMLTDYSQGVYQMQGLGQGLKDDIRNQSTQFQQQVNNRLLTAEMGRSVLKSVLIDMDEEEFEYANRSYQGASDIMKNLKEALVANLDIPDYKLFNTSNTSGNLSTQQTAGLAQRYDWNTRKNDWMTDNWVDNYKTIINYAMFSNESPISDTTKFVVVPNSQVDLTPLERLQMQNEAADRDEKNIQNQIYSALSAQSQYKNPEWDGIVTLAEDDILSKPPEEDDDLDTKDNTKEDM